MVGVDLRGRLCDPLLHELVFLEVQMFLSEKNLLAQGKALAWAIVSVVCAVAFWLVCDAIGRLS